MNYNEQRTNICQWAFIQGQGVFMGGGGGGQPGVAQKSSLFQYKNLVDYTELDYFSA